MSRSSASGIAWLVADTMEPAGFHCYWYTGRAEDHLREQAHVFGEASAVAWGRRRTPRVRIRTADRRSSWAGSAPRPAGVGHTWTDPANAPGGQPC